MISIRELDGAIRECENAPTTYQNCEKLATFYTILEHMQAEEQGHSYDAPVEAVSESDFMQAISGRNPADVWKIMDELMDTIIITNPRLYQGVMRKIKGIGG